MRKSVARLAQLPSANKKTRKANKKHGTQQSRRMMTNRPLSSRDDQRAACSRAIKETSDQTCGDVEMTAGAAAAKKR